MLDKISPTCRVFWTYFARMIGDGRLLETAVLAAQVLHDAFLFPIGCFRGSLTPKLRSCT
ncbi:hypothetical protein C8R48DRAFT_723633 [Suillus tomentosus]|nr:hypothetical protein C8R48DRAFT_723633 [Suillus tomentosus]